MAIEPSRRMSDADRAGFQARSPEGHAAKSMHIKGQEEVWIRIQADTFKNWVNQTLKEGSRSSKGWSSHSKSAADLADIENLETDFSDGTRLCALVEVLQKRKLKHNKRPLNQHHELENISIALDAIQEDGIKLVNIGNTDIHNGNLKLILGLTWSLIAHYQLGASNFPPKKLMLAWLKAVLPDCKIKNFTTDWNNGIYLSALLDHCSPGLMPNWKHMNPDDGPDNCQRAMEVAEKHFRIPMVLEPEYLSSPHLDELSGMTYLSYFMKEEDSPGYYATLDWVKSQLPEQRINNFRTDWNDGLAACSLVKAKGGPVPGYRDLDTHPENWISNLDVALDGGDKIGVGPVLEARDMANPNVEYLGVMAWAAQFQWIADKTPPGDRVQIQCNANKIRVGDECNFKIDILENEEVDMDAITAEVIGPSGPLYLDLNVDRAGARASFLTEELGMHEVLVKNEGEAVAGTPHFLRVMPKSKKDYDGIEPCAVGSTVEVLINPHHAARPELLEVTAYSPTNRPLGCPVSEDNGTFYASFQPDEAGEWKIHVTYDNEDIDHSPFKCMVFNPRAIIIPDQENARRAKPGDPFTFTVDASKTGWGEVAIDIVFENRSIRRTFYVEEVGNRIYQVTFTPQARGKHRVYVYLHGMEVKGSPFALRIGKDIKEPRKQATDIFKAERKVSRYKTQDEQRAERRSFLTEKEIPIGGSTNGHGPVAPPRAKHKRQTVQEFRAANQQSKKSRETNLFQSEHRTDDGADLLPVRKTVAFDCPFDILPEGLAAKVKSAEDVLVMIEGPEGKKCPTNVSLSRDEFTCQFTTSSVGQHTVEIVVGEKRLDNVTSKFYTYDTTKIKVGDIPPGYIGMPVEFDIDGTGAGFGHLDISVNGGKVTSHVSTVSKEKFAASFIPHSEGRHRLDIKFNGEKVPPGLPFFTEVKDPNTPLLSPLLITGKAEAPKNGNTDYTNNNSIIKRGDEIAQNLLRSKDFNKLDTRIEDQVDGFIKTTTTTKSSETLTKTKTFETKKASETNGVAAYDDSKRKAVKGSIADKKVTPKMDPVKDFGSFSILTAPSLIAGGGKTETASSKRSSFLDEYKENNKSTSNHITEKYTDEYSAGDISSNKIYSTTISKQVDGGKSFGESSFVIKTDPEIKTLKPTTTASSSGLFGGSSYKSSYSKSEMPEKKASLLAPNVLLGRTNSANFASSSSTFETTTKSAESSSFSALRSSSPLRRSTSPISRPVRRSPSPPKATSTPVAPPRKSSPSGRLGSPSRGSSVTMGGASSASKSAVKSSYSEIKSTISFDAKKTSSALNAVDSRDSPVRNSPQRSMIPRRTSDPKGLKKNGDTKSPKTSRAGSVGKADAKKAAKGSTSPKLQSYRGTAERCKFEGETVRHFNAGKLAVFELKAPGHKREDINVSIISPEKRPHIPYKVVDESAGKFRIEFTTVEVGSYVVDVTVQGLTVPSSPLIAKAYDAAMIRVTDIQDGHVGVLSTFRVDASRAGEGQLEISINDGDVPNAVQVLGGGKCLVTYTPEEAITHEIEVTFNDEQVSGSPFLCRVADGSSESNGVSYERGVAGVARGGRAGSAGGSHSKVTLDLEHLGLIPVGVPSHFTIKVAGGDDAELAVSVQGPTDDIPVKVTGNVKAGFTAEFVPMEVGIQMILVEYNGVAVGGTPFYSKAYDSENVVVSDVTKAVANSKTVTFAVDARAAGEGNLEILVQSGSQSLPTEVEAIGGNEAIFGVSFTPLETIVEESQSQLSSISYLSSSINKKGINHQLHQHGSLGGETTAPSSTTAVVQPHLIYVTFNDDNVPGSPFVVNLSDKEGCSSLSSAMPTPEIANKQQQQRSDNAKSFQMMSHTQQVVEEGLFRESKTSTQQHRYSSNNSTTTNTSTSYHRETRKQT